MNIYVGNLSYQVTEQELQRAFEAWRCQIMMRPCLR
jgi:hypothetical protein